MPKVRAFAAHSATTPLAAFTLDRRDPGPRDVQLDVLYCGVCHSDIHTARNEWHNTTYPCVPGHEIIGKVTRVGATVKSPHLKPGAIVGVGCLVGSCRSCSSCSRGLENYCETAGVFTYNSADPHGTAPMTYGGYSTSMTVDEHFVLHIADTLDPAGAAPLLCAGITTYSPLKHWKVSKGMRVGVVGVGGLGHMGVKFARALGAEVIAFTTSPSKVADAKRLGAHDVVVSREADQMKRVSNSLDFILNTVAMPHDLNAFMNLLRLDGTMCLVGAPELPHTPPLEAFPLIFKRRTLAGSLIGGLPETQEMLDFCAAHRIVSDIEVIPMQKINEAYERMLRADVKYRFVIDLASLR